VGWGLRWGWGERTVFIVIAEGPVKLSKNKSVCPLEGADIYAVRNYASVISDKGLCTAHVMYSGRVRCTGCSLSSTSALPLQRFTIHTQTHTSVSVKLYVFSTQAISDAFPPAQHP
jgi:hypothetical protein